MWKTSLLHYCLCGPKLETWAFFIFALLQQVILTQTFISSAGINILMVSIRLSSLSYPHFPFRITGKLIQDRECLYVIMTSFYINQLFSVLSVPLYFLFSMVASWLVFHQLESWQKFFFFLWSPEFFFVWSSVPECAQGCGEDYLEAIKGHLEALYTIFFPLLSKDMDVTKQDSLICLFNCNVTLL